MGLEKTIEAGLIISQLPSRRAVEIANALDVPPSLLSTPADGSGAARKLLALLTDSELRMLARHAGMPADGSFLSLYHRLALLC